MARGGARPNSGRKAGTVSEATAARKAVAAKALAEGISPLDVMLTTMRSLWADAVDDGGAVVDIDKALQANGVAKDAAPFLHPKLSSTTLKGDEDAPLAVVAIERRIVRPNPTDTDS